MDEEYRRQIESLYLEMYTRMFEYARSFLSGDALAEEAVQETFQLACLKPEQLCTSENPRGWLFNTLKFTCRNTLRRIQTAQRILQENLMPRAEDTASTTDSVKLEVLYGDLADRDEFRLLREMAVEGRSYLEMAEARGISVAACRKRVQRARNALQKKLKE